MTGAVHSVSRHPASSYACNNGRCAERKSAAVWGGTGARASRKEECRQRCLKMRTGHASLTFYECTRLLEHCPGGTKAAGLLAESWARPWHSTEL